MTLGANRLGAQGAEVMRGLMGTEKSGATDLVEGREGEVVLSEESRGEDWLGRKPSNRFE